MTAYGSYSPRNSPVVTNSILIAFANSAYSLLAGLSVFATLGFIAQGEGVAIDDLSGHGGPGLVFGILPVAMSQLEHAGEWERFLFVVLFVLGIDSAFAHCEAVVTVIKDTLVFRNTKRATVTALVCLTGFLGSLLFATDGGLSFLEVVGRI